MKLDYLELVFETCDWVRIPGKYIGWFDASDIETVYRRVACNSIDEFSLCHRFAVEIHRDGNLATAFGEKAFDRIRAYPDVTYVHFSIDGKETTLWVDYEEDVYCPPQKSDISMAGHLYLVIGAECSFEDCFNRAMINEKDYDDFVWDLIDDGN